MPPRRAKIPRKAKGKKKPPQKPVRRSSTRSSSYTGSSYGSEGSSSPENSDEDDPKEYKRGGYHPVMPYQLYNARYRVLSKLGAGAFSTVWLCADEKDSEGRLLAMKVCKSKKSVTEQAQDEVMLLERLHENASLHVVKMLDHFWHTGTNGRHKCMTFEVMGENLLALVRYHDYQGLPRDLCRRLSRHTLKGLQHIHACGVIHTDVKLENVLICRHDMAVLCDEASRAHRAFQEQKSGLEILSKSQKKRMKKKMKAKDASNVANADSKKEPLEEPQAPEPTAEVVQVNGVNGVNVVNGVNGKGKGQGYPHLEGPSCPTGSPVDAASRKEAEKEGEKEAEKEAEGPEGEAKEQEAQDKEEAQEEPQEPQAPLGQPVPPIRQRDRFETLRLEEASLESSQVELQDPLQSFPGASKGDVTRDVTGPNAFAACVASITFLSPKASSRERYCCQTFAKLADFGNGIKAAQDASNMHLELACACLLAQRLLDASAGCLLL
ncbi:Srpk2 [Symbiodinium natans]|uniref:non-specific serine/threonine protein kinase n=1 Tax=Symbiodinium natans TaxID=878477 RepID=A0A812M2X0_9DINO|nr:Srpk2 [Symbiodinium natans]